MSRTDREIAAADRDALVALATMGVVPSVPAISGARAGVVAATLTAAGLMLLGGVLALLSGHQAWLMPALAPVVLVPAFVGALIVWRRPANTIGWVLLADAVVLAVDFATEPYARYALLTSPGSLPGGRWALLWDAADWPTLFAGVAALALLFPEGRRLPGRRWSVVAVVGGGLVRRGAAERFPQPGSVRR